MKKIVFGITNLEMGGAERVLVDMANKLSEQYKITIFTIYPRGELEKNLSKKVKVVSLFKKKYAALSPLSKKLNSIRFSSPSFLKKIYNKYIRGNYDTEVAFLEGPITSLFAHESHANKVAWVHTNMAKHVTNDFRKKQYQENYAKYNHIIFVSHDALDGFNETFKVEADKKVIYNYIDTKSVIEKASEFDAKEIDNNGNIPCFLMVGRLVRAKGIDRLASVTRKLLDDGYEHRVYVIGDGEERSNIQEIIEAYHMKDYFILLGKKENPYPYMKKADYFVLPSVYEGFGMVLIEAMTLNKSILVTDTGAQEALMGYSNKLVVDNSFEGVYEGMKEFINKQFKLDDTPMMKYNAEETLKDVITILEGSK